jgi:spore maturation protein CgeB
VRFVLLGLSITSSWGNGHATTYRGLVRELVRAGHEVTFLERDVPWYAENRDLPAPPWGETHLYASLAELRARWRTAVRRADVVLVGSYVPDGADVARFALEEARGVVAFYDIDTPVTLAKLARGEADYLAPDLIPGFDLYLSFTGGPVLERLEREHGAARARALYCSADPEVYFPEPAARATWDLGYLGTYSPDRQPALERLLCEPARRRGRARFVVAGPQYPDDLAWPENVERITHLPPPEHRAFYNAQRLTLNVTRADMVRADWSPSVRLFEAGCAGAPIVSDRWPGLEELFTPGEEVLVADGPEDVLRYLELSDAERRAVGARAREKVLAAHTAAHRAAELVTYCREVA